MIFDGKAFAARRREELIIIREMLGEVSLGVVVSSNDPVTSAFVRIKEKNAAMLGVTLVRYVVSDNAHVNEVCAAIGDASKESGVIVQLPIPGIRAEVVLDAIPEDKDVDALSPKMVARFQGGDVSLIPPVAAAIRQIVEDTHLSVTDKNVVVVGKGRLVGAPCAELLRQFGAHVSILDDHDDLVTKTRTADIIVLGAGSPHLLKPEMIKEGVAIFDAGTSEAGGVVVGDADPACSEKASFFTPVPGGIGPVAVVEIFSNLFKLRNKKN
jgi:methylenetetrahydrofolate dehydrogenase (NADP+) / methenyltetrahydrofolate cyclohydrolase